MKICFLENTNFSYNSNDLHSPILRGSETTLINLSLELNKLGHKLTVINNCPRNEIINSVRWLNFQNYNENETFDIAISNNDMRFFDKINAKKKEIPIAIINARITTKTFRKWMLFPKTSGKIFSLLNLCLTSNSETKYYLSKLSAKNVHYNGNIKLINKINEKNIKNPNEKFLLNNKFWLAASTHKGEEYFCLQTHF